MTEHEYVKNTYINIRKKEISMSKRSCFNCSEQMVSEEIPAEIHTALPSKNNPLYCTACNNKMKNPPYTPGDVCPRCKRQFLNHVHNTKHEE